eukprot:750349-Amphidinium_carterae.3
MPVSIGANLSGHREHRADKPIPLQSGDTNEWQRLWQVCIDDFDVFEQVATDRIVESTAAGESDNVIPTEWQVRARRTYDHYGLPTSRLKAGVREHRATRLGYDLDGELARPTGSPGQQGGTTYWVHTAHLMQSSVEETVTGGARALDPCAD